jgi:hypothetical protein
MENRVAQLIKETGEEEAQEQIQRAMPSGTTDFLQDHPPEKWAEDLVQHPEEWVEVGLQNNLPGHSFPAQVRDAPNPWVKKDMEETSLEAWLMLVIPREES